MTMTIAQTSDDATPGPLAPLNDEQSRGLLADGFLSVPDMTDAEDIAFIRSLVEPILDDPDLARRAVVRAIAKDEGRDPVREVINIVEIEPRLTQSRFFRRAWAITEGLFGRGAQLKFDHVIAKPAYSNKETAWHQDIAYSRRITLSAKRLHWWLPLQPVNADNGCMQFVAGSHKAPIQRHWPVSADGHKATEGPRGAPTICDLPVGGATIHLPKTLHYTGPNITAEPRLAWIIQIGVPSWLTLL